MDLQSITPVILTLNEEPNIARTLSALSWARAVLVLDSYSTDRTVEIAKSYPNVRVTQNAFDSHAEQWNRAIGDARIDSEWVLSLDADYVVPAALVDELRQLTAAPGTAGYRTRFIYCIEGRPLRGSVYPPVVTLFRRGRGAYVQDGHTQRLAVQGEVQDLAEAILHDDRKPISRWLASQHRYMELEAAKLQATDAALLPIQDRVRKLVVLAPFLVFFYALFFKGAILDGRPGLYYAMQRAIAEGILSLHILRARLK